MKKRSMLAIASLATGFVVAAVSPSHGAPAELPLGLDVEDTVSTVEDTVTVESLSVDQDTLGQLGR
ncbi:MULTISPECIES: hypothetical protein [Streptomyces]|uniref:Secreted protein n=2 Tax=Streptomyces rochei group TaxID=2867164 RepID=A0AAX3ZEJ2_STRRO|nr:MULTISPECIES: hypothetical protein [Streptomyces]MBD2819069.1 hypothetical protein [Streptomyces parvulus]MDV6290544.1 hypothetical protein [Streptomyces sp. UP1A-1]RIH60420.1 hypothetical protein D3C59_19175 [Streptomyces sp. SHP22-7]KYK15234.1 hypothetical protein AUW26_02100 [Streptomyces sp. CC71]MBJ6618377.1 hypothetical protein [Streptomyces sp. DHE17-7]